MASGGRKQQDDEESWFSTSLKFGAALAVVAAGTYAAVKVAQKVTEEKEPPMPRSHRGSSLEAVGQEQDYSFLSSNAWSLEGKPCYVPNDSEPKRAPSRSLTEERGNMGTPFHGVGLVLEKEEEEPWCLSPDKLENWYNEIIQLGTDGFARDCRSAIDRVVRHVHENCSSNILDFDVDRVVKGGSLGKGTMVKDLSDVDLVAFVNEPSLKPIAEIGKEDYKETLSRIISDVRSTLVGVRNVKIIRSDAFLVNFEINVGSRWIDVDLLPTADNAKSHQRSYSQMFRSMLEVGNGTRQFYSASLVERQVKFVRVQPGYVKELIRMVKYWAYKFLPKKLQKSYPLELITIHLWEKAGQPGPSRLNKAQGLKSVLEVLTNLEQLRVFWQYEHSDEHLAHDIIKEDKMKRPIVLDPANPTNNVCYMYQWGNNMQVLAAAAEETLQTTLLRNVTAWPSLL